MSIREAHPPGQYPTLPIGGDRRAPWACRESGPPGPPKPRLLNRVREALRARHLSRRTEVDGQVAASTQNQALSALLFLYKEGLDIDLPWLDGIVRAKRDGVRRLMAGLLYGAGLRVLECCRLRVQDIDFASNHIVVRGGYGDKDRVTMLPGTAKADLARHLDIVRAQHQHDLDAGAGWVGQ